MRCSKIFTLAFLTKYALASINSIRIEGKYFVDSITGEPFYLKGVDYQPGGSSEFTGKVDPLSDPDICVRDIYLFQQLGINTVRVYSVNPDLNHDKCMTLFATAGIYVLLDVNSPLQDQHINRYEPWITYNEKYLEHVFNVMEQFSGYNNTLGFFAGNEIINDKKSAKVSPVYVKKLIQDMKKYSAAHLDRPIPVGYSAADDLDYRVSLASFLECSETKNSAEATVDFYGVNSYQWCGEQTMESSGYDKLVAAYENYTKPVFLSEFGCNLVQPRSFNEINALYSEDMYKTFSGGLVYEFSQEINDYGLVSENSDKSISLLPDFTSLKQQYSNIKLPSKKQLGIGATNSIENSKQTNLDRTIECRKKYQNLNIDTKIAKDLSAKLISKGVNFKKGAFVELKEEDLVVKHDIFDGSGNKINSQKVRMNIVNNIGNNELDNKKNNKKESSAKSLKVYISILLASMCLSYCVLI